MSHEHTPRKRIREPDEDFLAGFVSGFKGWNTSPKTSSIGTNKKASKPVSARDVEDFERFIASTSGQRRAKVSQSSTGIFDPLATPIVRQAAAPSDDPLTHNAKKIYKHLLVPHLASGQPVPPASRHLFSFDVPQRNTSLAFDTTRSAAPGAADPSGDAEPETSGSLPAAVRGRASELQMGALLVLETPHSHYPRIPPPHSNYSKSEPKPLVTPLTTSFAESLSKAGAQQATHKGKDSKLPPPPPPPIPPDDGPEIDPELTRGLGISPKKNQSGDRDRTGGGGRCFVLNGLAERAANLFQSNDMKLSIWQTEVSQSYTMRSSNKQNDDSNSSKRKFVLSSGVGPPGVRLRVVSLCERVEPRRREICGYVLAKCEILSSRPRPPRAAGMTAPLLEGARKPILCNLSTGDVVFVLFSLSSQKNRPGGGLNVCSPDLAKGAEVYVWEPWHEVSVSFKRRLDSDNAGLGLQRVALCTRFVAI